MIIFPTAPPSVIYLIKTEEFIKFNPDYILTPAVKPDYPDTGYTYMKAGKNLQKAGEEAIYEVADVVEKPNLDYLEDLLKTGVYFSHTGMYLWQLAHISSLLRQHQPAMYATCQQVVELMLKEKFQRAKKAL
jgi:mannose-1-phosphate guanylyltransferase